MMIKTLLRSRAGLLALIACSFSQLTYAVDINFAGFASFVYAKTITETKEEGTLNGLGDEGEYRDYNKLGLRLDANMENNLSFAAQLISEGSNDYKPEFDWIYASYDITHELTISVGKTRLPLFLYSDYFDVSYAYQWIEPPFEVYGVPELKSIEGLKLRYYAEMTDGWMSDLTIWAGKTEEELAELGDVKLYVENSAGISWAVEYEWLLLRAVYYKGDTRADISAAFNYIDGTGTPQNLLDDIDAIEAAINGAALPPGSVDLQPVKDELLWDDPAESVFYGLGASFDFEHVFIVAEATHAEVENSIAVADLDSWYIMVGGRLPDGWSLSLTYSVDKDTPIEELWENYDDLTTAYLGFSGPLDAGILGVGQGIQAAVLEAQANKVEAYTLTARWNFHPSASLKMEYLYEEQNSKESPYYKNNPEAIRLGVDLVF